MQAYISYIINSYNDEFVLNFEFIWYELDFYLLNLNRKLKKIKKN